MAYSFSNPQIETLSKLLSKLNSEMSVADAKKQGSLMQAIDDLTIQLDSIKADELRYSLVKRALLRQSISEGSQAQRRFDIEYEQDYAEYLRCLGILTPSESAIEFRTRIAEADRPNISIRPSEKWAADIVDLRSRGFSDEEIIEIIKSRGGRLQTIATTPQNAEAQEVQAVRQAIKNEQEFQAQQQAIEAEREKFYSTAREQSLKDRERAYDAAKKILDTKLASGEIKSREYNQKIKAIEANQSKLAVDRAVYERYQKSADIHKKISELDSQLDSLGTSELDQERAVNLHVQRDRLQNELLQGPTVSGESIDAETASIADQHKHDRNQERFGWATPAFITRNRERFEAAAGVREKRHEAIDNKRAAEKRIAEITKERDEIKAQLKKENLDAEEKAELETRNAELAREQQKQEIARQEAKDAQQQNNLRQEFKKFSDSSKKNSKKVEETLINALFLLMLFGPQIGKVLTSISDEIKRLWNKLAAQFGWTEEQNRNREIKDVTRDVTGQTRTNDAVTNAVMMSSNPTGSRIMMRGEWNQERDVTVSDLTKIGLSEDEASGLINSGASQLELRQLLMSQTVKNSALFGSGRGREFYSDGSPESMAILGRSMSPQQINEYFDFLEGRTEKWNDDENAVIAAKGKRKRKKLQAQHDKVYQRHLKYLSDSRKRTLEVAAETANRYDNTIETYRQATGESTASDTWTDADGVHVFYQDANGNVSQKVIPERQYREAVGLGDVSDYMPDMAEVPGDSFTEKVLNRWNSGNEAMQEAQTRAITSIQSISYTSVNYQQYAGLGNNFNP